MVRFVAVLFGVHFFSDFSLLSYMANCCSFNYQLYVNGHTIQRKSDRLVPCLVIYI